MKPGEGGRLPVTEAGRRILESVVRLPPVRLALMAAHRHVLAEPVVSRIDLPAFDNSAMDGFAVRGDDVRGAEPGAPRRLNVTGETFAGDQPHGYVGQGEAHRIMTGAALPLGADSVVRVEDTDGGVREGDREWVAVRLDRDVGRNVRRRGEELRAGETVLQSGRLLNAPQIGLLAAVGAREVTVYRRPEVAVLATGDELVRVEELDPDGSAAGVVASSLYALELRLREAGINPRVLGIARDDVAEVGERLRDAAGCDALITTAGVSVGERDIVHDALAGLGLEPGFWRVAMRPGSPFAFGRVSLGGRMVPWFGLPGNPVSTMVTLEILVLPALLRMAGHAAVYPPTVPARLLAEHPRIPELTQFIRVRVVQRAPGEWDATPTGPQGSGMLSSLAHADGLLVISPGDGSARGEVHPAVLLDSGPLREDRGY